MSKRKWSQSNGLAADTAISPTTRHNAAITSEPSAPAISRKVKACAACRKQKIKCIMDDRGPPCKRCTERNLSCVLNKSLQTLLEERSQWKSVVIGDLEHMHAALQDVLGKLSFPSLPPLQSSSNGEYVPSPFEDAGESYDPDPSCDNSPRVSPRDDALPHIPIESLYQITRLRALRSGDTEGESAAQSARNVSEQIVDFISQGLISVEDADRLVNLYFHRLDHYIYKIGGSRYSNLESLRRGSPILTAVVCTVAALHDPTTNNLYNVCNREFQRLMAASMFNRRIDRDHMLAMCVASYWLHDISWTMSGYAIRRATEVNLSSNFHRVIAENKEEAMECMRIWYTLYICDQHLSILYGRASIIREDTSILGWEQLMQTSVFTESDKRLVSQLALLIIMNNVRELFGSDTDEPIPRAFGPQLMNYSRQIDQWMGHWTTELTKLHQTIGLFPAKGVVLHHHLAKLHLHSYVFRGHKGGQVPSFFQEHAVAAVSAATSIIEMLLNDPVVRDSLVGVPHYIHSMIAFACVFLLKVAAQHSGMYMDDATVLDLTTKAAQQFRSTAVGKHHLVHLMADGLEKMATAKIQSPSAIPNASMLNGNLQGGLINPNIRSNALSFISDGNGTFGLDNVFSDDQNLLGTTPSLHFNIEDYDYNFARFGL